jgi:hypothetical protein
MDVMKQVLSEVTRRAAMIEPARRSPRCHHIRSNGVRCGSPALRGARFCYFHQRARVPQRVRSILPLEDANAVQCNIHEVIRGILDGSLDHKKASLLLYALQTASANIKHINFQPASQVETENVDVESCSALDPTDSGLCDEDDPAVPSSR